MRFNRPSFVCILIALAVNSNALAVSKQEELRQTFLSIRSLELPREVAQLVRKASSVEGPDRATECVAIVREAVRFNPTAASLIVGTASKVAPDLAAQFAAAAVPFTTKNAPGVARAAAASAPQHAAEIAAAVAKTRPAEYAQIAYEINYVVPGMQPQVVDAVLNSLPNLKLFTATAVSTEILGDSAASSDSSGATASPGSSTGRAPAVGSGSQTPPDVTTTDLLIIAPEIDQTARSLGMKTDDFLAAELTPVQTAKVSSKVSAFAAKKTTATKKATPTTKATAKSGTVTIASAGGTPNSNATDPPRNGTANPTAVGKAAEQALERGKGLQYDKPGAGPK
jgi:hypothetical protein